MNGSEIQTTIDNCMKYGRTALGRMLNNLHNLYDDFFKPGDLLDGANLKDLVVAIKNSPKVFQMGVLRGIFESSYKKGDLWKKNGMSNHIRMWEDQMEREGLNEWPKEEEGK